WMKPQVFTTTTSASLPPSLLPSSSPSVSLQPPASSRAASSSESTSFLAQPSVTSRTERPRPPAPPDSPPVDGTEPADDTPEDYGRPGPAAAAGAPHSGTSRRTALASRQCTREACRLSVTMLTVPGGTGFLPLTRTFTPDGLPRIMTTRCFSVQFIELPAYTMPLNNVAPVRLFSWTQQFCVAVSLICSLLGWCCWATTDGEPEAATLGLAAVLGFWTWASWLAAVAGCDAKC